MKKIKLTFGRIVYGLLIPMGMLLLYFFVKYILESEHAFDVFLVIVFLNFLPNLILVTTYIINDRRIQIEYDDVYFRIKNGAENSSYNIDEMKQITVVKSFLYHLLASEHGYSIISFNDGTEVKVSYLLARSLTLKHVPVKSLWVAYPIMI